MGLDNVKSGKLIYHLTACRNMESIIENGLMSRQQLVKSGIRCTYDVADPKILEKRSGKLLEEYVPFHFHPYTAFDFAVKGNHTDEKFVYITVTRIRARANGFKILPRHPLSSGDDLDICEYGEGYNKIDWETMCKKGNSDSHVKQVKMAECLAPNIVSVQVFHSIVVPDKETQSYIKKLLKEKGITDHPPYVDVQEKWF